MVLQKVSEDTGTKCDVENIPSSRKKREQTCAVSFNKFQSICCDGALLVELTKKQFLDVAGRIRDTLFFVTIAVGFGVEKLGIYSEDK